MEIKKFDERLKDIFPVYTDRKECLKFVIETLGYTIEKDYTESDIIKLARYKGIKFPENENMTYEEYSACIYSMLAGKTKDDRECFEYLAENGKFDILNQNKKVSEIVIFDGKTQPVFDYKECLFEKVFVEVPLDTDMDGKRDLIAVYIRRPKETLSGMKVPTIYVANPYMMTCVDEWYENMPDVDKDIEKIEEQNIKAEDILYHSRVRIVPPERKSTGITQTAETKEIPLDCITDWYNYFNSRGFASVYSAGLGTKGSEGMNCCGSEEEKIWVIAVIDWLCGRRKAYTNRTDNIEIKADWCNGNVAMSGKSYLGTLSIAAASTGVEGLKTIIPEAAISSWYNYYHSNGLNAAPVGWQGDDADLLTGYCRSRDLSEAENLLQIGEDIIKYMRKGMARDNGNYNRFWDERNYLKDIKNMKASAFIVHGINDWNVKTLHCHLLWKEMEKYGLKKKMILHQGDHIYIHNLKNINFNDIMNKWLTYWLYGIENNVMEDVPEVLVQSNLDTAIWNTEYGGEKKVFYTNKKELSDRKNFEERTVHLKDDVDSTRFIRKEKNFKEWQEDMILEFEKDKPYRLVYISKPVVEDMRISGTVSIEFEASSDQPSGILSAMLIDCGEEQRFLVEQYETREKVIVLGKNAGTMQEKEFLKEKELSKYRIISRGSINIQNRENNYCKKECVTGKKYKYRWDMIPIDYVVKKGHKLELVLVGSDVEITHRPLKITNYEISEETIVLEVPIIKK